MSYDDFTRFFELAGLTYMKGKRAANVVLKPIGITWDQFGTLAALQQEHGISQHRLAAVLETDTTTAMVICEGLEKRGLISRTRSPGDRRTYRLEVTDRGKKTFQRALAAMRPLTVELKSALSQEAMRAALPLLETAAGKAREIADRVQRRKK